ncbi:MlaC/ttg2D family ABC transporter substrate-binding protein [Syntrophus aciditrophicus]|nr:ABC transporter substrate-binding protein [Syntrophus aciditrophicus]
MNVIFLLLLLLPSSVFAGVPLDTVQVNVNKVLEVLRDPALKPASAKTVKKEKLRVIYERMFDEVELSRRALARHWNSLNAAQRQEFVHLFRQVLENAYIDKILSYTNEKIVFDRERMLSANQAEVTTRIVTSSKTIPITYRVIQKGGIWKVYDVVVENVSLIQNYRTQFNEILNGQKPEQLLQTLRKKVKEQQ